MSQKKPIESVSEFQKYKRSAMVTHRMQQEVSEARKKMQNYSDDGHESPVEYAEDSVRNTTDEIIFHAEHGISQAIRGAAHKGSSPTADEYTPTDATSNEPIPYATQSNKLQRQAIKRAEYKKAAARNEDKQRQTIIAESISNTRNDEHTIGLEFRRKEISREKCLEAANRIAKNERVQRSYLADTKIAQTEYRTAKWQKRREQTRRTAKGVAAIAKKIYEGIIHAAESLITALTVSGSTLSISVVVICLVGLLVGSCFGIFFSNEDTGTMKMKDAIQEINREYLDKIDELKSNYRYDVFVMEGSRVSWRDVLAIYAVKITTDKESGQEVVTVTDEKKDIIKEIFWDMNELSSHTEIEYETQTIIVDDGEGNLIESTETVPVTYLYISVQHKSAEDMQDGYNFDRGQRQQLAELLSPQYASMWSAVLYGISFSLTDSDEMLVAVALSQVGNVGGKPYWSWYGYSHRVEWCACFVSWCMNQCGYIDSGIAPQFASCEAGMQWFQAHGQWMSGDAIPTPGCIVFFDWVEDGSQDGEPEHVGIVTRLEDGYIWTVEGNTNDDMCCEKCYQIGSIAILGYGIIIEQ